MQNGLQVWCLMEDGFQRLHATGDEAHLPRQVQLLLTHLPDCLPGLPGSYPLHQAWA